MTIVKRRYEFQVTTEGQTVTSVFELEKDITMVKGVLLTSDKDDYLFYRGSQRIEVNKAEVVPDLYESKLLMSGLNLKPNDRYYDVGDMPAGNGQVKVIYVDRPDSRVTFEPYRVTVYLNCQKSI